MICAGPVVGAVTEGIRYADSYCTPLNLNGSCLDDAISLKEAGLSKTSKSIIVRSVPPPKVTVTSPFPSRREKGLACQPLVIAGDSAVHLLFIYLHFNKNNLVEST